MSALSRLSGWLRRPNTRLGALTLLVVGFIAAIGLTTAFNGFVAHTNTLKFCTSCHEMEAFVAEEYKHSPHYQNPSGVRATCPDCHVPHAYVPKILRKTKATFVELPRHIRGELDTPEKFEANRRRMAESVWAEMKADNSQNCRTCHDMRAMLMAEQRPRARAQHTDALTSGETCIDCHKGVAHKLPAAQESETKKQEDDFTL